MADENQRLLQMLKVYVKDCSLECPNSPAVFNESVGAEFTLNLNVEHSGIGDDVHEVVLTVNASAKAGDKTLYMIEVHHAALVKASGFPADEYDPMLNIFVPNQIYPFAREVIGSLSAQAGFPQVLVPIVNFEQLYQQKQAAQSQSAAAPDEQKH